MNPRGGGMASAMTAMNESRLRVRATTVRNRVIQDEFDLVRAGGDSDTCTNAQHSARSEEPGDGAVLDGDGRGVAGDHRGAAPAAGELHGGGRGAAADELRRQAPASGVRRHTLEADHVGQNLDAAVDLVRAERDDAVGRGGLLRRAQRVDGAGEGDRRAGAGPRGGPRRWPSRPGRKMSPDQTLAAHDTVPCLQIRRRPNGARALSGCNTRPCSPFIRRRRPPNPHSAPPAPSDTTSTAPARRPGTHLLDKPPSNAPGRTATGARSRISPVGASRAPPPAGGPGLLRACRHRH